MVRFVRLFPLAWIALVACGARPDLVAALARSDLGASRTLIESGADLDATDDDGNSVLMLAVRRGDAALVRSLLARRPDVRHANRAGATALHDAVDDIDKVRAL